MLKIFQDFYSLTGRLPLSNSQLVVPDEDAPPEEKLNMRHFYNLFLGHHLSSIIDILIKNSDGNIYSLNK